MTQNNNIVIYQNEDGKVHLDVVYNEETMWLTQQQLCELYQTSKSNVSEHIKHIFEDEELIESSVVRKFRTTASDGKTYEVNHYNLDMILSLGYRVRSVTATRFLNYLFLFCHWLVLLFATPVAQTASVLHATVCCKTRR